jgi:hypothetical protein
MIANCPVCNEKNAQIEEQIGSTLLHVNCRACSTFAIDMPVAEHYRDDPKFPPRLRYRIRKMQRGNGNKYPFVTEDMAGRFAAEPLPSLKEQADSLVLRAGDELRESNPAGLAFIKIEELVAIVGSYDPNSLQEGVIKAISATEDRLINPRIAGDVLVVGLTFKGWERYEQVKRTPSEMHLAFMAMPFNEKRLDDLFVNTFKPAVKDTGFELRRVDEAPRAGVIDNNLRVEIRKARFLIADLTEKNAGAYWEAGFAEGLGKPVFYTCEKAYFDQYKTHFDTNHCHTVMWIDTPEGLQKASDDLKATIRANHTG